MTKKPRTRFDAIADEIADPKPEPKFPAPPGAPGVDTADVYLGPEDQRMARRLDTKPSAFLNVMGRMIPTVTFNLRSAVERVPTMSEDVFGRVNTEVRVRVKGVLRQPELEDGVSLVAYAPNDPEPVIYRIQVVSVRWSQSGNDRDTYTDITAVAY